MESSQPYGYEPESKDIPLAASAREEIAEYSTAATLINEMVYERLQPNDNGSHNIYRGNLRQMERIAHTILLPHKAVELESAERYADAFYWGEILAMEIGDRFFPDEWSAQLYKGLNAFYLEHALNAQQEAIATDNKLPKGAVTFSADANRQHLAATMMLGALEEDGDEDLVIPEALLDLGNDLATELSADRETQAYICLGYKLVMRVFSKYEAALTDQAKIADFEREYGSVFAHIKWNKLKKNDNKQKPPKS